MYGAGVGSLVRGRGLKEAFFGEMTKADTIGMAIGGTAFGLTGQNVGVGMSFGSLGAAGLNTYQAMRELKRAEALKGVPPTVVRGR